MGILAMLTVELYILYFRWSHGYPPQISDTSIGNSANVVEIHILTRCT